MYEELKWVGVLGDDSGDVTLVLVGDEVDGPFFFGITTNQCRWLYEQLGAFCA